MTSRVQRVIVTRHGEREDVVSNTTMLNTPLTTNGVDKAASLGPTILKALTPNGMEPVQTFTSPFLRCIQTAVAFTRDRPADTIVVDPSLWEVWEEAVKDRGPTRGESVKTMGSTIQQDVGVEVRKNPRLKSVEPFVIPKDEGRSKSERRFVDVFTKLTNDVPNSNVLIVGHGNGVGAVLTAVTGETAYDIGYCGYIVLERDLTAVSTSDIRPSLWRLVAKESVEALEAETHVPMRCPTFEGSLLQQQAPTTPVQTTSPREEPKLSTQIHQNNTTSPTIVTETTPTLPTPSVPAMTSIQDQASTTQMKMQATIDTLVATVAEQGEEIVALRRDYKSLTEQFAVLQGHLARRSPSPAQAPAPARPKIGSTAPVRPVASLSRPKTVPAPKVATKAPPVAAGRKAAPAAKRSRDSTNNV